MVASFEVIGPIPVPFKKTKGGRTFDPDGLEDFWEKAECKQDTGVYIFAVRTGHGALRPWYVGRTLKSFGKEAFTDHKRLKFTEALLEAGQGRPIMFFLREMGSGAVNQKAIKELESDIINFAYQMNSKLRNDVGIHKPKWQIDGVGYKPTKARAAFRKLLGQ